MEKNYTYQELARKVSGASDSLYALVRSIDDFYKKNADDDNPYTLLFLATETLRNMSFTIDSFGDKLMEEADEMLEQE